MKEKSIWLRLWPEPRRLTRETNRRMSLNAEDEALFRGLGSEQCGGTVLGTISKKF